MKDDHAVFILTNGRADKVYTYETLRKSGYTGDIYLVIDDLDKSRDQYQKKYKDKVLIFDKKKVAATFDQGDNFQDYRAIIYARNACFDIAENIGIKYFFEFDDDYTSFRFRFDDEMKFKFNDEVNNLDQIFKLMIEFYKSIPAKAIAFAQGGDFLGGKDGGYSKTVWLKRKCMNSFLCSTERKFQFIGRVNEDVNTYTRLGSTGDLFFTFNQIFLNQKQTQSNSGGMTEMYLSSGTYLKSFYSVMYHPSSITIQMMKSNNPRLHHNISWKHTVPRILDEKFKKRDTAT